MITRRQALQSAAAIALSAPALLEAQTPGGAPAPTGPFKLPPLGYAFDALEPHFDARTMEIHHDKHHAAYVANLNKALADYPDLQSKSLEDLLKGLDSLPEKIRTAVRNNAGGHYNHTLFWQCLKNGGAAKPEGKLADALNDLWKTREEGEAALLKAGLGVFGSGWVWVTADADKKLHLATTPNQDSPISKGQIPILGLDVWEHAYYLKFQNRRADYIKEFYQIINWEFVQDRYEKLTA